MSSDHEGKWIFKREGKTAHGEIFSVYVTKRRSNAGPHYVCLQVKMLTGKLGALHRVSQGISSTARAFQRAEALYCILLKPKDLNKPLRFPKDISLPVNRKTVVLQKVPMNVHENPANYLDIGDEIYASCRFSGVKFYHSGIYAGFGMVYHFMSAEKVDSLSDNVRSMNQSCGKVFYDTFSEYAKSNSNSKGLVKIYKVLYPLRLRSRESIVKTARKFYEMCSLVYDVRRNNCQNFSSLCSTGGSFSYDMESNFKNTIMRVITMAPRSFELFTELDLSLPCTANNNEKNC